MIRIHEIKRSIGEPMEVLPEKALKKLKCGGAWAVESWKIVRESVDARNKRDIRFVYSLDISLQKKNGNTPAEAEVLEQIRRRAGSVRMERVRESAWRLPAAPDRKPEKRPVIAGFGPCGMFAALVLAEAGTNPVVLERGKPMPERLEDVARFWEDGVLDPESNVQFGEGGAGTFSDGKLTTGIVDPRIRLVLESFVAAGAGSDILYRQRPHIGTDVLREVVPNLRKVIEQRGGCVLFQHRLSDLEIEAGRIRTVKADTPFGSVSLDTDHLILATGHSARDTFALLLEKGIRLRAKPFSIGLRIEHPQRLIDEAQYGSSFQEIYGMTPQEAGLPPAEYKLSAKASNGRGVYTFCMCPGGHVITASSEADTVVVNGMSCQSRAGAFANSAVLTDVRPEDFPSEHPLAGVEFQRRYEQAAFRIGGGEYRPPQEVLEQFMQSGSVLAECLPPFAVSALREGLTAFGKKLKGFDRGAALLTGVETRSSSPVRILRNDRFLADIEGIYPGGEGAGYAGGIMSAAVDGIRLAEAVIQSLSIS